MVDPLRWFRRRHPGGDEFEHLAEKHLKRIGLVIRDRNVANRHGELDLVAEDPADGTIVFVEVRGRTNPGHGLAEETVGAGKRRTMARVASAYLEKERLLGRPARFDVVAINVVEGRQELRHIPNAFGLDRT